jgi:5,10-methylenetetrahydrofolate reductase
MPAKKTAATKRDPWPAGRSATGALSITEARVILEACPPAIADREKAYAILRQCFSCYDAFHTISIPDIQDVGEFSRKRVRVPNDEFAAWLRELTGKPVNLYKVSVTCTADELERWLARIEALGCRDIFLVGPDSSSKQYKAGALSVGAAAGIARQRGFRCGGIIIPTRRSQFIPRPATVDEAERIETKVRTFGLSFFTTQIIYESEWTCCLLLDLVRRLQPEEIPRIFLTFSPFVNARDISFAKNFLGVYLPPDVERMLRGARSIREASITCLLGVWERISTFAGEIGFPVERLGVNAEYIDSRNPRNVDAAFELAEEFGRILKISS